MEQKFYGYFLNNKQKVVSLMGPSGTGKTFSAEFLQSCFQFFIIKQLTTRPPRPDDQYYNYISKEKFIEEQNAGKILGYFSGDKRTLSGNGYGYYIEEVLDQLNEKNKIILFPSPYELNEPTFAFNYGTTSKIGLGFKEAQTVVTRALQSGKIFTDDELRSRVETAIKLTAIMQNYSNTYVNNFSLIYSDEVDKTTQLKKITSCAGYNPNNFKNEIEDYLSR